MSSGLLERHKLSVQDIDESYETFRMRKIQAVEVKLDSDHITYRSIFDRVCYFINSNHHCLYNTDACADTLTS